MFTFLISKGTVINAHLEFFKPSRFSKLLDQSVQGRGLRLSLARDQCPLSPVRAACVQRRPVR